MAPTATPTAPEGLVERPRQGRPSQQLFECPAAPPGEAGRRTLEDVVLGVWEELDERGRAECPVCGGTITVDGGCSACGSELS